MEKKYKILKDGRIIESEIPGRFAGIKTMMIFGRMDCKSGMRAKKENRIFFHSWDDAIEAGYRPCKNCKPMPNDEWEKINGKWQLTSQGSQIYYKVVTEDLKSLGLLRANQLQYSIGKWAYPLEPLSDHSRKGGGLWVSRQKSGAFGLVRYLMKKYQRASRVFVCIIGEILYQKSLDSCRVKTDKLMLIREVIKQK